MIYAFVRGPFVWLAVGTCLVGIGYQIVYLYVISTKKDRAFYDHFSLKWSLKSILMWLVPFGTASWRANPLLTLFTFFFHLTLITTPLLLLAHNVELYQSWGVEFFYLPEKVTDYMTLVFLLLALCLLIRRLVVPHVRSVSSLQDFFMLAIAALPFLTGYAAFHQWFESEWVTTLHIISGGLLLAAIPFTKLAHMFLYFICRAQVGIEFGARRGARTW